MDLWRIPEPILCDLNHFFVDSLYCHEDDIALRQSHLCYCILVRNCGDHPPGICCCFHQPEVGCSLHIEESSVGCRHKYLVHLIGEWHSLISP